MQIQGHCHARGSETSINREQSRRLRQVSLVLLAVLLPLLVSTVISMCLLWPKHFNLVGSVPEFGTGAEIVYGTVVSVPIRAEQTQEYEEKNTEDRTTANDTSLTTLNSYKDLQDINNGSDESSEHDLGQSEQLATFSVDSPTVIKVELDSEAEPHALYGNHGKVVEVPIASIHSTGKFQIGDRVRIAHYPGRAESPKLGEKNNNGQYYYVERARQYSFYWLGIIYFLVVALVAGKRGLGAILGLTASLFVILGFVIPAMMEGSNPILVSITGCMAMIFLSVYLAHGVSVRTTTALLGTLAGIFFTFLLAIGTIKFTNLVATSADHSADLLWYLPNLNLNLILLAGIIVAGIGPLNDVAITQASAVWELYFANPIQNGWQIFRRAMRIGRDHIASTVYTLAFAFVGTSMPALILVIVVNRPFAATISLEEIAETLVGTFVASLGLVITIPLTTALATLIVGITQAREK